MAFISPAVKWICLLLTGATLRTIRFDKTIMSISHSIGAFRTTNIELHSIRIDPIKHLIYVFAWYPFVLRRNTRNPRVKHKVHGNPNRCAPIEINTTHVQNVTIFFNTVNTPLKHLRSNKLIFTQMPASFLQFHSLKIPTIKNFYLWNTPYAAPRPWFCNEIWFQCHKIGYVSISPVNWNHPSS